MGAFIPFSEFQGELHYKDMNRESPALKLFSDLKYMYYAEIWSRELLIFFFLVLSSFFFFYRLYNILTVKITWLYVCAFAQGAKNHNYNATASYAMHCLCVSQLRKKRGRPMAFHVCIRRLCVL